MRPVFLFPGVSGVLDFLDLLSPGPDLAQVLKKLQKNLIPRAYFVRILGLGSRVRVRLRLLVRLIILVKLYYNLTLNLLPHPTI